MEFKDYKYVMKSRGWKTSGVKDEPLYVIEMMLMQLGVTLPIAQKRSSKLHKYVKHFIEDNTKDKASVEDMIDFLDAIFFMLAFTKKQDKEFVRHLKNNDYAILHVRKTEADMQLLTLILDYINSDGTILDASKYFKRAFNIYIEVRDILEIPGDENKGLEDSLRKALTLKLKEAKNQIKRGATVDLYFYDKNPEYKKGTKNRKNIKFVPSKP